MRLILKVGKAGKRDERYEERKEGEGSSRSEYTVDEAMEKLNLCRKSIYNYIERGTLSASKMNGKWMIQGESLKRLPRKKSRKPWEQLKLS